MKKGASGKKNVWWIGLIVGLIAVNVLASFVHYRIDLTQEKRYSLSAPTRQLLRNLDEPVRAEVYLKGEFPANFKKLANSVEEFLQEARDYSHGQLHIEFVDPFKIAADSAEAFLKETKAEIQHGDTLQIKANANSSFKDELKAYVLSNPQVQDKEVLNYFSSIIIDSITNRYDINPYILQAPSKVGDEQTEKRVLPGIVLHYKDTTIGIDLLKGIRTFGTEHEQLAALYNNVEASLEYKFASALQKITATQKPSVAYALGNGEGWGYNVNDAVRTLISNYNFDTVNIRQAAYIPPQFNALVILKPTQPFTDADKFKIDQYVMHGGKVFWMIDNMYAEFDSLYKSQGFIAFDRGLNLEDILFNYGVRINQTLLQDMQCDKLPQVSTEGNNQQQRLVDWPFFPVLNGTNHPISKNLDGIRSMFPTTIDTVEAPNVRKTFLLQSSNNARVLEAPAKIDFEYLQIAPDASLFRQKNVPVAALLEGKFRSLYTGRTPKSVIDSLAHSPVPFQTESTNDNKMIVVADGDIAMNQFSPSNGPLPMGMNFFTHYTFANKDFYLNCLEYLVNPTDILQTRAKEYSLRLLDPKRVSEEKTLWQLMNIALPIALIIIFGLVYQQIRKRKYAVK